jgi:acyl-CoA synthetase (NDP forming)
MERKTDIRGGAGRLLSGVRETGREALLEHEVYELAALAGFETPRFHFLDGPLRREMPAAASAFLSSLPGRVVVKVVSPDILHKSEAGGVRFSPARPDEVLAAARGVWEETGLREPTARRAGLLLVEAVSRPHASPAGEVLISFRRDPAFGPVLFLGLGGLLTEWFGEATGGASTAILEPGRVAEGLEEAERRHPALRILFRSSRAHSTPPLDVARTAALLERLAIVASAVVDPEKDARALCELEINPAFLTGDGNLLVVDGKARLGPLPEESPARPVRKIGNLLKPRSAAVFGASSGSMNPGRIILRNLKASQGLSYGHLHAVHPKESTIDGVPCVASADLLPETVDLAVVAIPAEGARDTIVALSKSGKAESIILIPGGFAETGRRGLENEIRAALARSRETPGKGPVLLGGNCLGLVSKWQYNTFFLPQYKLPFHDAPGETLVAVSQSGAYLVSLTSNMDGLIFPLASISYGNQMDLTVSDFLEYYADVPEVKVIACYIEGFQPLDGHRFVRLARKLRGQGRRILAFKAGKTALGAKAAQSHTASLAGDYAVARSLMQQAGVEVAESLDEFEDFVKAITMLGDRTLTGRRTAVISNAGFECSSVLDRLYGLELAVLTDETLKRLAACLPAIAHADNPVDATPMAGTKQFSEAVAALLDDPNVDNVIVSPIPVTPALDDLAPNLAGVHSENIYSPGSLPQEVLRLFRESTKPVVANIDSGSLYDDLVHVLQRGGIPVFRKIDRASRALSAFCNPPRG